MFAQDTIMPLATGNNVIQELFFAGLKDKLIENYSNADKNFSKIIALDSKNDAAYYELATINFRQKKLLDAEIAIKNAIELKPNNLWYLKLQAEIYKQNGNMDALINVFDQLIKLSPEEDDIYFDKANAYILSGKKTNAQNIYALIEQKFGNSQKLKAANQRLLMQNAAIQPTTNAIEKLISDSPNEVKNYLYLSGILLDKNKYNEALDLLIKAKNIEPDNFEIALALADVYKAENKDDLAMAQLQLAFENANMPVENKAQIITKMLPKFNNPMLVKNATFLMASAIKTHPNNPKLNLLFGDVLYQQGNLNEAQKQYQIVLKNSQQVYLAWEKLLGIQTLMGQYSTAIKTGEEALSIYPNQAILYYYLAFALHRNGQNAEAGLEIKSALMLDSEDTNLKAMIFALQAEVLIDQQKFKEADLAFDKAITLKPDNYLTLSNYAYYLALRNYNLDKAETLAAKSAAAMPANTSIADTYALVLFKLGKYNEALQWIKKALGNSEPYNPIYLEHYGDILFLNGDVANALIQWQKAKQAGNNAEKLTKKINEKKYFK